VSLKQLFVAEDGAPRAFWRAILFLVAFVLLSVVAIGLVAPLVGVIYRGAGLVPDGVDYWVEMAAGLGATGTVIFLFHRGSWRVVGLDRAAARPGTLVFGFGIGFLAIAIPTAMLIAAGWLVRAPGVPEGFGGPLLRVSVLLLPASFAEELLMRGYLFAVIRRAWGPVAALGITSVVFALLHLQNPGVTTTSLGFVALAGVFLGGVLLATDSLYAAWMAHFAWNWAMAAVFHVAVSGLPLEAPGYRYVDAGPAWATGGSWGPEAGVPAGLGMIGAVGTLVYMHTRRRRRQET
jgi:hypothetical protein